MSTVSNTIESSKGEPDNGPASNGRQTAGSSHSDNYSMTTVAPSDLTFGTDDKGSLDSSESGYGRPPPEHVDKRDPAYYKETLQIYMQAVLGDHSKISEKDRKEIKDILYAIDTPPKSRLLGDDNKINQAYNRFLDMHGLAITESFELFQRGGSKDLRPICERLKERISKWRADFREEE